MPIKKRTALPAAVIDYNEEPKKQWFNNLSEPTEKKPLPPAFIFRAENGVTDLPSTIVRKAGFLFANDEAKAEGYAFNVHEMLAAVRTPYNPDDPQELRVRARIKNRGTAISAVCYDCQGGSRKHVTECNCVDCPLWAFRLGGDPMRGKR